MNNQTNTNQNVSGSGNQGVNPTTQPSTQPVSNAPQSNQPVANGTQPVVNPGVGTNTISNNVNVPEGNDSGAIVNENLKKVEINYTPPSKFKIFCMIFFFILLVVFVLFLPEITTFVNKYRSGELNKQNEKIINGRMKCSLSTTTTNLDKNYNLEFAFTNNALETASFEITTRGDVTLDEDTLDELNKNCKQLVANTKKMSGVSITCDYTTGKLVEIQKFKLKDINQEDLDSAFVEAGGNKPGYKYGQNMDTIEKQMSTSGYTCERLKS